MKISKAHTLNWFVSKKGMISLLFAAAILLSSCRKIVDYPEEPAIDFTSIFVSDSTDVLDNPIKLVTMKFHMIDGNGDIGLDSNYMEGPFHPDSAYHFNLIVQEYYLKNSQMVEVPLPGGIKKYRIPDLTPSGQNKTLIADIYVKIEYPYSQSKPLPYSELQYVFYIYDRALNISNKDTTASVLFY